MGFGDFWIQNGNGKEQLKDTKHGVRKEQVDKKFHNLFDAYDTNQDGTLESNELDAAFSWLNSLAKGDKVLDANENIQAKRIFADDYSIENADFQGFVKELSRASQEILSSQEIPTSDGGKEIRTKYADGTVETISYYPDGDFKFKKTDKIVTKTHYEVEINGQKREVTKQQYKEALKRIKSMSKSQPRPLGDGPAPIRFNNNQNIKATSRTTQEPQTELALSERGAYDASVRDFVLSHYIETHQEVQDALDSMGILDDTGALINTGAGELWNLIKNKWNGTDEEYQNFYELVNKFEPSYNTSIIQKGSLDTMRDHPEMYFRDFETDFNKNTGHQFDLEKTLSFQQTTERYQQATIINSRLEILKKAMSEIRMYESEQAVLTYAPVQNEGLNPASHIVTANKLLLQYFNDDQDAVNMLLNGTIGSPETTIKAISELASETEKQLKATLGETETEHEYYDADGIHHKTKIKSEGITYDQLKEQYQNEYKEMYGVDFVPDELMDKVMSAKATGGMVKIAAITIVSILITKSPVMTEIMGASAGSLEATGAAVNFVRGLVAKYGQTVVQQGIKFAMTTGTLATDVGLTILNQVTDSRDGVQWDEVGESTKSAAKYIYFGAYVGAPMAQAVARGMSKIGATARLFEGGTKTAQGAITTTTISGDKLVQNFMKGSLLSKGASLGTEITAFAALDLATEDINLADAFSGSASMQVELKIMSRVLEYMLGGRTHTAMEKAKMDAAIKRSGVKDWTIKEIKTPSGTKYTVEIKGISLGTFKDTNSLATAIVERVSMAYSNATTSEPKANSEHSAKIDLTNLDVVKTAKPQNILRPTEATTFGKDEGITFKPNVMPSDPPSNAYKMEWGKTVQETIELNQKNGVPLELVKDESTGEYFLGVKHSWDNQYYRVDRESIIVKYGEGDFAPVAEDNGAHIFTQTYLDANTGKPIDISKMKPGEPLKVIKNPNSTIGAVAFDKPTTVTSLEGDMPNVEMARTDVDGHPYGSYAELKSHIIKEKIVANESDPNSARFIELVKAGKDTEAMALLKQASTKSAVETIPATETRLMQSLDQANDRETFVKIRDEIKKMPLSDEKSRLMKAYTQKYNAWSSNPSRPDIRMKYIPSSENPHNIVNIETADAVGAKAEQALAGRTHRIATAGYSAPPEGYETATRDFLRALDSELGAEETAYVTSPTADKGSIDAITSEVAGFKDGRLFYTTAQDYVEYINPENFPPSIDAQAYAKVPKFVLPDATSYSAATAEASNAFIATGGRNATVSDFVNAIKKGNKAVILDNTSLEVPAWGEAKSRVENASKYLAEQIKAVKEGKPLPYPEIGEFTRAFIEANMSKIDKLVRTYQIDGRTESINVAASQAAKFIKSNVPAASLSAAPKITIDSPEFQAIKTELTDLYKKKKLTDEEKVRVTELETEVQKQGILVAKSPLIEQIKISMLAKAEPREAFLPDFSNEAQLKEMGFTKKEDGKWYHSNSDWYPDALSDKDVVYVFKRDASGKPIDTGFGPKDELPSLYVRSEDFDNNNMRFVQPSEMKPGQIISVKKCASGTFCILPVGTKIFTSEGIVEVKPGEIVNVKEAKNSVHTSRMSDVPDMYKADPLNPASKELFDLINEYKAKEPTMTETEQIQFQARISDAFSRVNRGQKLIEILGTGETAPKTLRDEYDVAARISKAIDEKYLSRIDCSNFDKGLEEAGRVMDEILADKTLNAAQKQAAIMGVMTHMVTTTNLHQHGKGSTPKDVTLALAREKGLPESTITDIEAAYAQADKGYPVLSEFNKAYDVIGQVIRTPEDYKASINGIIRESMKRGQLICEIRCACDSLRDAATGKSLTPREGTLAIMKAIEEVKAEIRAECLEPPETSFVFLTFRGKGWDGSLPMAVAQAKEVVRVAEENPDMRFGYDVAGPEDTGWGPKAFKEAMDIINQHNEDVKAGRKKGNTIGITMHAGETPTYEGGEGYKSVLDAIGMGAVRIGHGIQLAKYLKEMERTNPEEFNRVLNLVKEKGITIEICGVCNIQSIPINSEGMEQHAIQTFLDYGIPVTICTDNDAICGTNISKEYTQFLLTGHSNFMDWNAIKQSVRDGVDAAFITDAQKTKVRAELETRLAKVQKLYDEKTNGVVLDATNTAPSPIQPN